MATRGTGAGAPKAPFRNPHNLPTKDCVVCHRPFTWRKKWEKCWDEVLTCSNRCKNERRGNRKGGAGEAAAAAAAGVAGTAGALGRGKAAKSDSGSDEDDGESEDVEVSAIGQGGSKGARDIEGSDEDGVKVPVSAPVNDAKQRGRRKGAKQAKDNDNEKVESDNLLDSQGFPPEVRLETSASKPSTRGRGRKHAKGKKTFSDDEEDGGEACVTNDGQADEPEMTRVELRAARKAHKQDIKAERRKQRAGSPDALAEKKKPCDVCERKVDLLIRCTCDESGAWRMLCGKCWKDASGGVPDGDADHPHYRYGGIWKNRSATITTPSFGGKAAKALQALADASTVEDLATGG